MIRSCVDFTVSLSFMVTGKTLLDYSNLFSLNDYKMNDKVIYNYFTNIAIENASLDFRLKTIDETRNYLLEEIKQ